MSIGIVEGHLLWFAIGYIQSHHDRQILPKGLLEQWHPNTSQSKPYGPFGSGVSDVMNSD